MNSKQSEKEKLFDDLLHGVVQVNRALLKLDQKNLITPNEKSVLLKLSHNLRNVALGICYPERKSLPTTVPTNEARKEDPTE